MNKFKEWDKEYEMCKQHVMDHWDSCNDISLRETSGHMQECYAEYYEVTKSVLSTDQNPYGFLENGEYLSSWRDTSSFIHAFHHSCIDDGEHCYLSDPLHGPMLIFRCHYDYTPQELYYIVHPQQKQSDERMEDFYDRMKTAGKQPPERKREFEFHNDYKRFIKELNERPEFERKRNEEFKEKMEALKKMNKNNQ